MGRPDTLGNWTLHGNDDTGPAVQQIDRFVPQMPKFSILYTSLPLLHDMGRPDTLGNWALHGNDISVPGEKQIDRFVTRMLIVHNMVDEFTTTDTKLCFTGRPAPHGNRPADSVGEIMAQRQPIFRFVGVPASIFSGIRVYQ